MTFKSPIFKSVSKGYFSDQLTFGKENYEFKMDSKDTYRWYDRLYALFFGVQWTKIFVRDPGKNVKPIYVRTSQLAKFLQISVQTTLELTLPDLTKKFYNAKKLHKLQATQAPVRDGRHPLQVMMSFLDLHSLAVCCRVSKAWKAAGSENLVWKSVIYRQLAFGNDKWAQCFGADVVKNEAAGEDFASLPLAEIIADFKKIKNVFPEKKAIDCLMLVRLPKTLNGGLSLNSLAGLVTHKFPANNPIGIHIMANIAQQMGNVSIDKSYWVLMTKHPVLDIIKQSRGLQNEIDHFYGKYSLTDYKIPGALEAATCILSQFLASGPGDNRILQRVWTRCLQLVKVNFAPRLSVLNFNAINDCIGVAPLRRF